MEEYTPEKVESYTQEVKDICAKYKSYGMIFKKKSYLKDFVEWKTSTHLSDPFYTFRTKLYWIVHDLTDFPRCKECGKPLEHKNIDSVSRGYCDYCSNSCSQKSEETQNKIHSAKHLETPVIPQNIHEIIIPNISKVSNEELAKVIWNIKRNTARGLAQYLTNHAKPIYDEVVNRTSFLLNCDQNRNSVPILARLYCISNHLTCHPTCQCPDCDKPTLWNSKTMKFNPYCCDSCRAKAPMWRKQVEETCIRKYNASNPSRSPIVRMKYRNTCNIKYGTDNYAKTYEYHKKKKHKFHSEKYPELTFDSKWEVKVYEFCRNNNIPIEYSPSISYDYEYDGKTWTYHPDFLINGNIYEVKGDNFFRINEETGKEEMFNPYREQDWSDEQYDWSCGKFEAKHQCMLKNNVTILRKKEVRDLQEVFKHVCTQ